MTRKSIVSFLKGVSYVGVYGGLLMPLVFIPIVIFPFVFSKLIFFQILIGLTFPAYVFLAWMEPKARPKSHLLYLAIVAYFVALALSVAFAVDPMRAWWGNQERMNGLFTVLHFLAWLTMAVGLLKTWEQWRRLLNYEVALSAFMAIIALLQKVNPSLLLFPAGPRVGGLLDNPIYMGAYQIFNLFFLALLALRTRSRSAWIWYAVFGILDLAVFFFAQSRGDLVGLAAGIVAFAVYVAVFSKNKKARYGILGLALVAFLSYGTLFAFRHTAFVENSPFGRLTNLSTSLSTRLIAWDIAWKGFLERPLTGWGFDDFHILFNIKYNPQSLRFGNYETWFDRSHNTILDVLSMTGILGFVTFAGIFLAVFYCGWRAYRKGWIDLPIAAILFALPVAYFIQNLFVFDHPAAFSMSYLLYALVIAATQGDFVGKPEVVVASERSVSSASSPPSSRGFSLSLFLLMQAAFCLLVWRTSVLPFEASRLAIQANNMFGSPQGWELVKQAADIWTPYRDEQTFLLSRNLIVVASQNELAKIPNWQDQYALAKRITEEELSRHPRNTHPHYIYAQLASTMASYLQTEGQIAEQQYLIAIDTSPKRQQLYYGLADLYTRAHRPQEANDLFRKVKDFDLEFGYGHWIYGLSLFYDLKNQKIGAQEIALSQKVAYAYQLTSIRELTALSDAYTASADIASLKDLVKWLPLLPNGAAADYAKIAYRYRQLKMTDQESQVMAYAIKIDPSVQDAFDELVKQGR